MWLGWLYQTMARKRSQSTTTTHTALAYVIRILQLPKPSLVLEAELEDLQEQVRTPCEGEAEHPCEPERLCGRAR